MPAHTHSLSLFPPPFAVGCIHSRPGNKRPGRRPPPKCTDKEIRDRIECSPATVSTTIGSTSIRYAYLSQRGALPCVVCVCCCVP